MKVIDGNRPKPRDGLPPAFKAEPMPMPTARLADARRFALTNLYFVFSERRSPAAKTPMAEGSAVRSRDQSPNDTGDNPCPTTERSMTYREAMSDAAKPRSSLKSPRRRSRAVRRPRLIMPIMYADASP